MTVAAQAGADRVGLARWSVCLLLVAGLHAGVALRLRGLTPVAPAPLPEAVLVDLVPADAPAPEAAVSEPERREAPTAPEAPPADPTPPDIGPPEPEPETVPPEPPAPAPEAALPLPPPAAPVPLPVRRMPPRPAPPRPAPEIRRPAPAEAARPAPAAAPFTASAAPAASASSQAPAWQGALLGRLQRAKRYPDLARARREEGVAHLTFSMDRNGRLLSARIARSSGSEALDAETLALVRRAEPLPAPPADVSGDPLTLTVPVRFSLR